jgi:hypothetical protein
VAAFKRCVPTTIASTTDVLLRKQVSKEEFQ